MKLPSAQPAASPSRPPPHSACGTQSQPRPICAWQARAQTEATEVEHPGEVLTRQRYEEQTRAEEPTDGEPLRATLTPDTSYLKQWFRLLMGMSTLQCHSLTGRAANSFFPYLSCLSPPTHPTPPRVPSSSSSALTLFYAVSSRQPRSPLQLLMPPTHKAPSLAP